MDTAGEGGREGGIGLQASGQTELKGFEGGNCDRVLGQVVPVSYDAGAEGKLPVVSTVVGHRIGKRGVGQDF